MLSSEKSHNNQFGSLHFTALLQPAYAECLERRQAPFTNAFSINEEEYPPKKIQRFLEYNYYTEKNHRLEQRACRQEWNTKKSTSTNYSRKLPS